MRTIVHLITGLETGGAERMLAHLATRTNRDRFRPVVVSMTGTGTIGAAIAEAGVIVRTLGMRRGLPDARAIPRLARILREFRPVLLQTWLYHADLLGLIMRWLRQAPHLVWCLQGTETIDSEVVRRILAWRSQDPDTIVTAARGGQRFHESIGYHPRRWAYIPNAVDTVALHPDPERRRRGRAQLGLAEGEVAILLPARYHPMKDHANFLAAAAQLAPLHPEARFFLAGAGTQLEHLASVAALAQSNLAGRVVSLGERSDLEALYPAFDIVTLASAFGEALPMVLAEAMACGVPCVATDTGDCAAVIGDTGIIVPARDPQALATGWRRMIALGVAGRHALGLRARAQIVENYNLARIVPQFETLYCEITAGDPAEG